MSGAMFGGQVNAGNNSQEMKDQRLIMKKAIWAITTISFLSVAFTQAAESKMPFELDGIRWVLDRHEEQGVPVFSNNGIKGTGLTLSFIGKLESEVLDAYNLNVTEVILGDGTKLTKKQIRTKSRGISSFKEHWGIRLGEDKLSVGIQVDLTLNKLSNFKSISGHYMITRPIGEKTSLSRLLKDKAKSREDKLGIEIDQCMDWGTGRYFLLKLRTTNRLQEVKVFDEEGNEFELSPGFQVISETHVKLYVKKKQEADSFKVSLNYAEEINEIRMPFSILDVMLIE